eukprot:TRINITY_DN4076_c0_g2_i3.p1 TRINITY_DN4076_c0_g2~~TRINITY_DN4076_c0_g2_i3.p1  ORF type:complete len:496 (-),score=78.95 TRINITY_DN4076_c0_g2_i3:224-1711(-)
MPRAVCTAALLATFFYFAGVLLTTNSLSIDLVERQCQSTYSTPCKNLDDDQSKHASSLAAPAISVCLSVPNALSLFAVPWLCRKSDILGRRPVLCLSVLGSSLGGIGSLLVSAFQLNVWLIVPFWLLSGLGGGLGAFNAAMFALVADTVDAQARSQAFSLLESAIFLGCAVGPLVGGISFAHIGPVATYGLGLTMYAVSGLVLFCGLPAVKKEAQFTDNISVSQFLDTLIQPLKRIWTTGHLVLPCVVFGLHYLSVASSGNVMTEYGKLHRFNLSSQQLGYLTSLKYSGYWLWLVLVLPCLLSKVWKPHQGQVNSIRVGTAVLVFAMLAYGFSSHTWQLYVVSTWEGAAAITIPSVRTMLSLGTHPSEQGSVLSVIANLETGIQLIGPLMTGSIYSATVQWYPSFTFFLLAAVSGCAFLLSLRLRRVELGGDRESAPESDSSVFHASIDAPIDGGKLWPSDEDVENVEEKLPSQVGQEANQSLSEPRGEDYVRLS